MTREAFEQAIVSMMKQLHYVSYSLLPNPQDQEDAVQECLRNALQKRETLRQDAYLKTWVIRILINVCHNMRKKKQREVPTENIPVIQPPTADGAVFAMISTLEEKYRLPIVLHHHAGYATKEVAQILRIPEGTVKGRLVKGRQILQDSLMEKEAFA